MPLVVPAVQYQEIRYEPEPAEPYPIEQLYWTDARGRQTNLSTMFNEQYKIGLDGRASPPWQHISEQVPEQDGERYRLTRALPRALVVMMTFVGRDITEVRARIRTVASALNPKLGVGTLTVYTVDGIRRSLKCLYESGLESTSTDTGLDGFTNTVSFTFRAHDPYWYDIYPVTRKLTSATAPISSFFPITPVRLGGSTIFASYVENNVGDVEAWPVWQVTGPGSNLILFNETTGKSLVVNGDFASGTNFTVDTRPRVATAKTIKMEDGTNLFPQTDGALWSFAPGPNQVIIELTNTTPQTQVNLTYTPGYVGV